jgi:hypothetical protein
MISLEILTMIISLCNISALEDNRSKWTELAKVEKYQKECRVYYIDCYEKNYKNLKNIHGKHWVYNQEAIIKCIKDRVI